MSTITKEFTKEQLIEKLQRRVAVTANYPDVEEAQLDAAIFKIALASLEAEPVAWLLSGGGAKNHVSFDSGNAYADPLREVTPLYTASPAPVALLSGYSDFEEIWSSSTHPLTQDDEMKDFAWDIWNACRAAMLQGSSPPAPVSAPDEDLLHMAASAIEDLLSNKDRYCAGVWADIPAKLRRAAMLQGADGTLTNEGTIPVTQFKPVADLYGLTSPTGGETSFTFDAVEARDFIDGGWSCQEYVELGRYQEALTDHSEDKLAMVDHSGDSNNMVEPVTTACKLRDAVETIRNSGIAIDADKIFAERDALNSPVIPDGWVLVPIEPTPDMREAYHQAQAEYEDVDGLWSPDHQWQAMHAAAPEFREIVNSSTNNCRENAETSTKCWCHTCRPVTFADSHFVVCPECGNKRCPHANDHRNACTGSNEPGQEGSAYPAAPQQEVTQALAKGMERYGDAMQKLADSGD
ncbi:TPA: hypothetical protein ACOED0_002189 [Enterobacter roggenkampii]